jgi:hypothetical protein
VRPQTSDQATDQMAAQTIFPKEIPLTHGVRGGTWPNVNKKEGEEYVKRMAESFARGEIPLPIWLPRNTEKTLDLMEVVCRLFFRHYIKFIEGVNPNAPTYLCSKCGK